MHRKRHLLSGLLTCGACGGSYAILVKDRYGCSNHYRRGACTNGHTIRREEIEARVLEGLKHKLVAPERSEEHTSELQSLMRISYAVFCLKKTTKTTRQQ